jgi:hypothetical protein
VKACSKPGCAGPGAAVLAYDYAASTALLDDPPEGVLSPHLYVLCARCAERLRPPRGWVLEDRRTKPRLFVERDPVLVAAYHAGSDEPEPADEQGRTQLFFGYSA